MKLEVSDTIPHAPARVFAVLRDEIAALAEHMENVESVEILEQIKEPPLVRQRNRWQGVKDSMPAVFRPFVSREALAWLDQAEWNEETLACNWRIEPVKFKTFFTCTGTTTLEDDGAGGCRIALRGDAHINLGAVPGLPAFVARRIQPPVERFVVKQLRPNFSATAAGLRRFLDA